jgi:hypothetical protein
MVKVKLFLHLIKHCTRKTYEVVDAVLCPSHFTMHKEPPLPIECKDTKCIIKGKNIYSTGKDFEVCFVMETQFGVVSKNSTQTVF